MRWVSQHVIPSPSGVSHLLPRVVVVATRSVPGHEIERTGSAQDLATRPREHPSRQAGLRDGFELPVVLGPETLAIATGHVDFSDPGRVGPGLQNADSRRRIVRQARRQSEARRAAADDEIVEGAPRKISAGVWDSFSCGHDN